MDNFDRWYQVDVVEWLKNGWGREAMIPVFGSEGTKMIRSYLIPKDRIEEHLINAECDFVDEDSFRPQLWGDGEYHRYNNNEQIEPLVTKMLHAPDQETIELVEEFRYLFKIYYDSNTRCYIDYENDDFVVAQISEDDFVKVNIRYLKRYLAVKRMALVLWLDNQILESESSENAWGYQTFQNLGADYVYSLTVGYNKTCQNNFTLLRGKKIITGCRLQDCGFYPFEQPMNYVNFIIGYDKDGSDIEHSCDPKTLVNILYTKKEGVLYLTPVFFKAEVLSKYYNEPEKYDVGDGYVARKGEWRLRVDTGKREEGYVSAYLGDLGNDLPSKEEQLYWRSYNVNIDGNLSNEKVQRDFYARFTNPSSIDFVFKDEYKKVNDAFRQAKDWSLFLDLHPHDQYNFNNIRILTNNSDTQFDQFVLSLVKVLIDSLNEKKIKEIIKEKNPSLEIGNLPGISKLEEWFKFCNLKDFESHIKFLRNLQQLRSTSSAHRKGKSYEDALRNFNWSEVKSNKERCLDLLNMATDFLKYVFKNIEKLLA